MTAEENAAVKARAASLLDSIKAATAPPTERQLAAKERLAGMGLVTALDLFKWLEGRGVKVMEMLT